jgi:hypothetical protein
MLLFELSGGSLSGPLNFFFASLIGLKVAPILLLLWSISFKRFLNTFKSFLRLFYTFFGPLVYLKNFPTPLKNFATIGSGSFYQRSGFDMLRDDCSSNGSRSGSPQARAQHELLA